MMSQPLLRSKHMRLNILNPRLSLWVLVCHREGIVEQRRARRQRLWDKASRNPQISQAGIGFAGNSGVAEGEREVLSAIGENSRAAGVFVCETHIDNRPA